MHIAARFGHSKVVDFLLAHRKKNNLGDLIVLDRKCQTPLHLACILGNVEVVEALLEVTTIHYINLRNSSGHTPSLILQH